MSLTSALRAATCAAVALVLLAGCASTVGGSAVPGTTASSTPDGSTTTEQPTTGGSTGDQPAATSALPSLGSIVIPQPPSSSSPSVPPTGETDDQTGRSTEPASSSTPAPATSTAPQTPTVVTTTVSPSTTSSAPATTSQPTGGDPFAGATAVDPADYPGTVTPVGFSSPSGNITCGYQPTKTPSVVCQIDHHTYPNPSQDCHGAGAPGGAITLSAGGTAEFLCAGDLESGGPALAYGSMISVSGLDCVSRESGVSCRDPKTGNGFRIATASYDLIANGKTIGASAAAAAPSGSLSRFTGTWGGHGRQLTFTAPGKGTTVYRSYVWCTDNPNPPCDSMKNNQIVAGGKVTVTLTSASSDGATATGTITASNDPAYPTGTHVTATISGYNLTLSTWPDAPFCAANTPSDKWNCGA